MISSEILFEAYGDDPLLSADEAAAYLRVSKTTFNDLRRREKFPVVRFMGDARFRRSDLNRFINSHMSWGWNKIGATS
jgi:excisionase family DNA binding protein